MHPLKIVLSAALLLPLVSLADGGTPIGSYLTPDNTSTTLGNGVLNGPLPQTWVKVNPLTFNGTATNSSTVTSNSSGSAGLLSVLNQTGSTLYVYMSSTDTAITTNMPGFGLFLTNASSVPQSYLTASGVNAANAPNTAPVSLYIANNLNSYAMVMQCANGSALGNGVTLQYDHANQVLNVPSATALILTVTSSTCTVST
jgi:hypothetical protein